MWMYGVREQNYVTAAGGIDPDRGARESGVAIRTDGKQIAAIARKRRIDIPSQAPQDGLVGGRLGRGEFLDGQRGEEPRTITFARVEHHLSKLRQIVGGGG